MTLDELKSLNPNDPSSWPIPVKLVVIGIVCVLILGGGFWFLIQGEIETYEGHKAEEEKLRQTYLDKKALAINLPAYVQQMEEMEQTFGSLLRQLPNSTEVPDLLVDITQAGLGRGLEFVTFRPEKEQRKDFYAEFPITLEVSGSYHELALFVSDVASLPRIVTFADVNIAEKGQKKGARENRLSMTALAKTYRYLEAGGGKGPAPARKTNTGAPATPAKK